MVKVIDREQDYSTDRNWRMPPVYWIDLEGQQRVNLTRSQFAFGTVGTVQVFGRRHHERRHALRRPASKKRQGTKSREVWGRVGSQRYGDLIFAPIRRRVPLEGLSHRRAGTLEDDAASPARVHPALSHARAAQGLPPHPPLTGRPRVTMGA
jgi:hypothetical protein